MRFNYVCSIWHACALLECINTNTRAGLNQQIITHYFSRVRRMKQGRITFIPSGTQLKVKIHLFNMKFFRIIKISLWIFLVFQMLDDFTAAQLNTMIPMGQSETFPIIHARKSIC
jgi:hypothetical protein